LATLESKGNTSEVKFSPDGKLLVASSIPHEKVGQEWYATLNYWRAPTFEEIGAEIAAAKQQ
jgi:hypothetical protein